MAEKFVCNNFKAKKYCKENKVKKTKNQKNGENMAYLALYRQFRPRTFDDVIGQPQVVETLKNQIKSKKIGHAYLFCGTRGTGKTTCAKILAKAVNCLAPKDGSPCGECEVCKSIQSNGNLDIVEIDAASNNGVDQIRDLREKVNFLPTIASHKVYIIDEVHMLTESAFNALLKTLEEPPEHVIFILATTEPEKIPATILSRCMRFDFKLISIEDLTKQLKKIFDQIGVEYEGEALELIAKAGKGSDRDTLSIAEMCKSFTNQKLTYQKVEECLGKTSEQTLFDLANAIVQKDGGKVFETIENVYSSGKNLSVLLADLCECFKNMLAIKLAPNFDLQLPNNIFEQYKSICQNVQTDFLLDALKKLSLATSDIKFCEDEKSFLISTFIGLFFDENAQISSLKSRVDVLEKKLQDVDAIAQNSAQNAQKTENLSSISPKIEETHQKKVESQNPFSGTDDTSKNQNTQNLAKKILGELVKFARESGGPILFQSFGDVVDAKFDQKNLVLVCKTQDIANIIKNHKKTFLNFLKQKFGIEDCLFEVFVDKDLQKQKQLASLLDGKLKTE